MPAQGTGPRVLVVSKRTLVEQAAADPAMARVRRLIRAGHPAARGLRLAHEEHARTLALALRLLARRGLRAELTYDVAGAAAARFDVVMTVGGDGTVLAASHHLAATPLLGVNSAPSSSAGFLTTCAAAGLGETIERLCAGRLGRAVLARLAVLLDGTVVHDRALNDVLFTAVCPAATARYYLRAGRGRPEEQLSSGIWVATAAGSTAAIRAAGGRVLPPRSRRIQYLVREPFPRGGRRCRHARGIVGPGESIGILNRVQPSLLYIDGPHRRVEVAPGQAVEVRLSPTPLVLLGWTRRGAG